MRRIVLLAILTAAAPAAASPIGRLAAWVRARGSNEARDLAKQQAALASAAQDTNLKTVLADATPGVFSDGQRSIRLAERGNPLAGQLLVLTSRGLFERDYRRSGAGAKRRELNEHPVDPYALRFGARWGQALASVNVGYRIAEHLDGIAYRNQPARMPRRALPVTAAQERAIATRIADLSAQGRDAQLRALADHADTLERLHSDAAALPRGATSPSERAELAERIAEARALVGALAEIPLGVPARQQLTQLRDRIEALGIVSTP